MRDSPDPFTCASLIKACGHMVAIREGKSVHSQAIRSGLLDHNLYVLNTLIHFYLNSTSINKAFHLFDAIPHKTIVTVNCMISGLLRNRLLDMACRLFGQLLDHSLRQQGLTPNRITLVTLIPGCSNLGTLALGKSLHAYCTKSNILTTATTVCNALINLYLKFGCTNNAAQLFNEMPCRDLVSWNTMMAGYCKNHHSNEAISLFAELQLNNVEGDQATWVSLISACGHNGDVEMGKWVHSHLNRSGAIITLFTATSLINMYAKCGLIDIARQIFDEMPTKNMVSWNSMILGYIRNGCFAEALSLFKAIKSAADEVTMLGLLSVCRNSGAPNVGRQIHAYMESSGFHKTSATYNALIDMYAKVGSLDEARIVFNKMPQRDVVSWTTMIMGHAINGEGEEAVALFQQMCDAGIKPNSITFVAVLSACDHAGLVEEGRNMYKFMSKECRIEPQIEHCGCMVDILARSGLLDEAYEFVRSMPVKPNAIIWRMLIGSCKVHANADLGTTLVDRLLMYQFDDAQDLVISSNMYATVERWGYAAQARALMHTQKIQKDPGTSSVIAAK